MNAAARSKILRSLHLWAEEYFWPRVDDRGPGCWPWTGARLPSGYGRVHCLCPWTGRTRLMQAHAVAYLVTVGLYRRGLVIMHACDQPPCCRPGHLAAGEQLENVMDCIRKGRFRAGEFNRQKITCPHGHPYDGENLIQRPNGARMCRECHRRSARESQRRRRAEEMR